MGREVRMVPPDWEHPKSRNGRYDPLHDGYSRAVEERAKWREGFVRDYKTDGWKPKEKSDLKYTEEDYFGSPVNPDDYMPEWPADVATHYRMYETCSEGTPISPPMPTPEALARWLADNGASAFGDSTASYEGWLGTIRSKHGAVGLLMTIGPQGTTMTPAVEMMAGPTGSAEK